MAYLVTKTFNNGYRCCCHQSWESSDWVDDREQALAFIPKLHHGTEFELEKITVTCGATREIIGCGQLEWLSDQRGDCYRLWRWSGHVDGQNFDQIVGGEPGESWFDLIARRKREVVQEKGP